MSELEIETARAALPLLNDARYKAIYGGRGSGKSHFFADLLVEEHIANPDQLTVCIREYQRTLTQSVKRLIENKIAKHGVGSHFEIQERQIKSLRGSGGIIFEGMQNYNADSIKSLEGFDRAWFAEAQRASQKSLDYLRPTIRKEGSQIWFDWNPDEPTDPIDIFLRGDNVPKDAIVVEMNYQDNPWFPEVLRVEMEYDRRTDPDKYAHIWLGKYNTNSDKRVFKNWKIDEFETPEDAMFYFGADWGFAQDPTVLVRCYIVGKKLFIDYEAYEVGCEIVDIPTLFMTIPEAEKWSMVADCSRPETISHLKKQGFPKIFPSVKGKGSISEGVEFLRSYEIIVHPRCVHVIDELTLYSYKIEALTGRVTNILEDKNNHCIAEGEKVTCRRGDIPIESVTEEDEVLTTAGFRKVLFSGATGYDRDIVIIRTTNGTIKCTPEHEIWTPKGFTRADALRCNDDILIWGVSSWLKELCGMVGYIAGILKAIGGRIGFIFKHQEPVDLRGFIVMCGKASMELFRKGVRFIIKMATRGTTALRTLLACLIRSMLGNTRMTINEGSSNQKTLRKSGIFQSRGIKVQKESRSTEKSERLPMQDSFQKKKNVNNVGGYSIHVKSGTQIYSAPTLVNQHGEEVREQITKQGFVMCAEKVSSAINTPKRNLVLGRVLTVEGCGKAKMVYDLTVEDNHEFFCNGILVSNCIDSLRYALEATRRAVKRVVVDFEPIPTINRW